MSGGNTVTISGTGFYGAPTVVFGTATSASVVPWIFIIFALLYLGLTVYNDIAGYYAP